MIYPHFSFALWAFGRRCHFKLIPRIISRCPDITAVGTKRKFLSTRCDLLQPHWFPLDQIQKKNQDKYTAKQPSNHQSSPSASNNATIVLYAFRLTTSLSFISSSTEYTMCHKASYRAIATASSSIMSCACLLLFCM